LIFCFVDLPRDLPSWFVLRGASQTIYWALQRCYGRPCWTYPSKKWLPGCTIQISYSWTVWVGDK